MECDGELDGAEVGRQVASRLRDGRQQERAQFGRDLRQRATRQLAQRSGFVERVEQRVLRAGGHRGVARIVGDAGAKNGESVIISPPAGTLADFATTRRDPVAGTRR
jgi:hypothetical protein